MRIIKRIMVIFLAAILLGAFSIVKASDEKKIKHNINDISSIEENENNNPKCTYKEGEVIITYEKSFWKSDSKLSLGSLFDKYRVNSTTQFDDIQIDSDKTVSIDKNDSKGSTLGISLVKSDKRTTEELIEIFKNKDWIISVEPNYIIKLESLTNDAYQDYQWAIENKGQNGGTKKLDINPITTSSENEKVIAVLDTGVDYTHEDLKNIMWVNPYSESDLEGTYGYDFANNDTDPIDDGGHGTNVAGIIAAETNNNTGVSGAILGATNIKIMALKILDNSGGINDLYKIIEAYNYIYKAQTLGTNIIAINNSWGGYLKVDEEVNQYINSLSTVIDLVGENGALSICAAGNEKSRLNEKGEINIYDEDSHSYKVHKLFPSGLDSDYIISVAASNEKDELAEFSNYGECVDICAPGTDILTTATTLDDPWEWYDIERFIPSIYSNSEKEKLCEEYWDFENCSNADIPFTPTYRKLDYNK